jgi:hypothetical protein
MEVVCGRKIVLVSGVVCIDTHEKHSSCDHRIYDSVLIFHGDGWETSLNSRPTYGRRSTFFDLRRFFTNGPQSAYPSVCLSYDDIKWNACAGRSSFALEYIALLTQTAVEK